MTEISVAIVGANRGRHHGRIWKETPGSRLVGFCDKDGEKLHQAMLEFEVEGFKDYETMLAETRPNVVHVVTSPAVPRHIWIKPAKDAGVKTLILEKPYALTPETAALVEEEAASCQGSMEVLVNHQRRYMTAMYALREYIRDGHLGAIENVVVTSQGEIMEMGTHVADLLLLLSGEMLPETVWATISGSEMYDKPHLNCPDNLMACLRFPPGYPAFLTISPQQVHKPDWGNIDQNKYKTSHYPNRLNLWVRGKKGNFKWREYGGWQFASPGLPTEEGPTDYFADDVLAQKQFNKHVIRRLQPYRTGETEREKHYARFDIARCGMKLVFAMYRSALLGELNWDADVATQAEWGMLRERLIKERNGK